MKRSTAADGKHLFNELPDLTLGALITDALGLNEVLYTSLNGITVFVDPRHIDRDDIQVYLDQLVWSYDTALHHSPVVHGRRALTNLVPEFEAMRMTLVNELPSLPVDKVDMAVDWLERLGPLTWCPWVKIDRQAIVDAFLNSRAYELGRRRPTNFQDSYVSHEQKGSRLVGSAVRSLRAEGIYYINKALLESLRHWLKEKDGS